MKKNFYAVIMAGGGGTRLWPVSRKGRPKQLLKISDDKSLYKISIERIQELFSIENIFVVTIADQIKLLKEEVPGLPDENYIVEPFPKGTASVVGLAAVTLKKKDPSSVMAVLTADHIIKNKKLFHQCLMNAYDLAENGYLVTMGIVPDYPATGYGYIQSGKNIENSPAQLVEKFVEKPDRPTAEAYLKEGNYYWNSGMFVWQSDRILVEFKKHMPELHGKLMEILEKIGRQDSHKHLVGIWGTIEPQTIDYGIMEHAKKVTVLPAEDLGWSDVGSWDSLYKLMDSDKHGNVFSLNNVINLDSQDILVYSENAEKVVVVIGLNDLVIVDSEKALLVCSRGETQKVKTIIETLKKKNLTEYL